MKDKLMGFAFILLLAFLGGKGIYWVTHDTYYADASQRWPTVTGRVVESKLEHSSGSYGSTEYAAYVKYAYTVNDLPYVNDQIRFPPRRGAELTARKLLKKFHTGANIPVYYDPDSPQNACLLLSSVNYFFVVGMGSLSVILLLLSLWMLRVMFRKQ